MHCKATSILRFGFSVFLAILGTVWIAEERPVFAVHAATGMGEIEGRPSTVGRRKCLGGVNLGILCDENADCPGSTCDDRNVFNITVSVRFNATAGNLTTIQNAIDDMADTLFDVTDGQAQIGQVTILNNSFGSGGDIWVHPDSDGTCSLCADSGHYADGMGGHITAQFGRLDDAGAGEGLAHEFIHLAFDARDEYEARAVGCGGLTGAADCPTAVGEECCLMDCGGLGAGGTELCYPGNHEPALVTEQSRCRSNRSCWEQVDWSWPSTFKMPAGAPDPEAAGGVIDPLTFFNPASDARLVLVLDRSGSMTAETPDRIDRLKTAALDFVALAENGIELGLVSFSTTATDEEPIAALAADRSDYTDAINDLVASGRTNIGDGLQHAKDMITAAGGVTGNTAIILMTDGVNNEPLPDPATDLQSKIDMLLLQGIPVYVTCTGSDLGLDSQCAEIAAGTLGTYVDSASGASLPSVFGLLHELVMGRQIGATMEGNFSKPATYTVMVEPKVTTATFLLQWDDAAIGEGQLQVTGPNGVTYDGMSIPQGQFVRVSDPIAGDWRVMVSSGQTIPGRWTSRAFLQNQNLMFGGHLRMKKVEPGEAFVIYGHPLYGGPIGPVSVSGMVTKPDGSTVGITLVDTGQVTDSGDDLADDGLYTATFTDTAMRGAYSFHLRAVAVNAASRGHSEGPPITNVAIPNHIREVVLSGTVNDVVGSEICNGNAFGEPGATVQVPIVLDDGTNVAGFQVDVLFNPLQLTPTGVAPGADTVAAGGWNVAGAPVGPGVFRVIGASNPPVELGAGFQEVALVSFTIAPGIASAASPLGLTNCVLSDDRGIQVPCHPCGEPGGVIIRLAGSFKFRPLPIPIGVDLFAPLPFGASAEAINSFGDVATAYNGMPDIRIPNPECKSKLVPNTMSFVGGIGTGNYVIPCCIEPLLPATTFTNVLELHDSFFNIMGTSDTFLGVAKGDLNGDNTSNVLDVVRTTRLSLLLPVATPPSTSFQRWAGDMLGTNCAPDGTNNVLDVVRVENKALGLPPLCPCTAGGARVLGLSAGASAGPVTFRLEKYAKKDYLVVVEGAADLGGFQFELRGAGPKAKAVLEGITTGGKWQLATSFDRGVLRVLAFSADLKGVNGGGPVLRIIGATAAQLEGVIASDSRGEEIPVR